MSFLKKQEPPKVKGLDLGELMKDVGLDLEGFDDPSDMETSQEEISVYDPSPMATTVVGSSGTQLLAQIQQPLPLQVCLFGTLYCCSFQQQFLQKNCRLQRDSNSDLWSRRRILDN